MDAILREAPEDGHLDIRTYAAAWSTVSEGVLPPNDISAIRQAGTLLNPPLQDTSSRLTRSMATIAIMHPAGLG